MQQLLYKYLILHNRLNIPSLGSFSVSYSPAQYNAQDGTLLPKQPVLHFKDGPPATADTGLLPFLAAELKISSSVAANELLNFSLQLMSELVEHKRAHLKGLGTLTKDSSGVLHFHQEQSSAQLQPAVATREVSSRAPVPVPPPAAPVYQQPAPMPVASTPPMPTPKPTVAASKKILPEGNLDPTLDYAGINSYQDSPELMNVRQQLAQRREQVNAEFGDLREAKERMKRVPIPGKEAELGITGSTASPIPTAPSTGSFSPSSTAIPPRATPTPTRTPNPLLANNPSKGIGKTDYPAITESLSAASQSLADLPIELPKRTIIPREKTPQPEVTDKWMPSPRPVKPFSTEGDAAAPSDPLTVRMPKRTWQAPVRPASTGFTGKPPATTSMPSIGMGGRTTPKTRIQEQKPFFGASESQEETTETPTKKWPWQKWGKPAEESFDLPARFAEEEEESRPGFWVRLKESITGIFNRKANTDTTIIEEEAPELSENKVGGIFAKASSKLVEMKNSELDTSGEPKKDYWWVYAIFMTFIATVALIIHMI